MKSFPCRMLVGLASLVTPAAAQHLTHETGAVCFAEETPPELIEKIHAALGPPPEYNLSSRWSGTQRL